MVIRRVVSLTALVSFVVLSYTGIMLFIGPQGRVAYWTGWKLFGLSKEQYGEVHSMFMLLFLTVGIWHTVLNWKAITRYLRNRSRQIRILTPEFVVALALGLFFLLGTLARVTPFQEVLAFEEGLKTFWEERDGSPPWGHAEENSLDRFTRGLVDWERLENQRSVSFDIEEVLAALRAAGYEVADEKDKLIDIARVNGTTPQALMSLVVASFQVTRIDDSTDSLGYPRPVSGLGRMSLRDYAGKYGVDLDSLLRVLAEKGIAIDPDQMLRNEAERWDTDPEGLLELAWVS